MGRGAGQIEGMAFLTGEEGEGVGEGGGKRTKGVCWVSPPRACVWAISAKFGRSFSIVDVPTWGSLPLVQWSEAFLLGV